MLASELRNDELINEWLRSRRATANTRRGYLQAMQEYTEFD